MLSPTPVARVGHPTTPKPFACVTIARLKHSMLVCSTVALPNISIWFPLFPQTDKINCNICDQILEGLEVIDDELDVFGIHMVKIQDPQLAKRYSIKTFPALVYFRYCSESTFKQLFVSYERFLAETVTR